MFFKVIFGIWFWLTGEMNEKLYIQVDDSHGKSRTRTGTGSEDVYVGKYKLIKTIGKGNFAKVKLAKHLPTGREVCTIFIF